MNAVEVSAPVINDFVLLKNRLKTTWMTGDYDLFSRYMEKGAVEFFNRMGVAPGTRLLDVACGSGQLALIAARAGADVTGCDIAVNWLEKARERAEGEGLNARFDEGDAENLPYPTGEFDVVTSLVGAMFAPRPYQVGAELLRVCKPGGKVVMANWTPGGFVGQMFKAIARHIAPSGMPAPALWGDEETVRKYLSGAAGITCTPQIYHFQYPFAPDGVVDFFRAHYGPMSRAFDSLDGEGQRKLRNDLVRLWYMNNKAAGGHTHVEAEYLEVVATRA